MHHENSAKTVVGDKIKKYSSWSIIFSEISRPYRRTPYDLVFISLTSGVVKIFNV